MSHLSQVTLVFYHRETQGYPTNVATPKEIIQKYWQILKIEEKEKQKDATLE